MPSPGAGGQVGGGSEESEAIELTDVHTRLVEGPDDDGETSSVLERLARSCSADHHGEGAAAGPTAKMKPFVALVAVVAALGGLVFGYDIGGSGGSFVMPGFREHFGWPKEIPAGGEEPGQVLLQMSLINSLFPLGGLVGAAPAGVLADRAGRRVAIMGSALLFTVAAAIQAAAPNIGALLVGRLVGGAAIGVLSTIVPVYIAEMAPEHFRGTLSTLWQLAVTVGIVLASALNIPLAKWSEGWRLSYGLNLVFSAALFVLMATVMPESPRWLCMVSRFDEAVEVLHRVRQAGEVAHEAEDIRAKLKEERSLGEGTWLELLSARNSMRARTLLGVSMQFFQQFSGINAIMFFAPAVFARYFTAAGALYGALAINVLNHLATYITLALVDTAGRVVLMVSSGAIMTLSHILVALVARLKSSPSVGIAIIALSCGFVVCFAYGWGPVTWTVCSEIFPLRLRGKAVSVTTSVNWGSAAIVGLIFPLMSAESALGLSGTFGTFAAFCACGTIVLQLRLPETANASLEDIDTIFTNHKPSIFRKFWAPPAQR